MKNIIISLILLIGLITLVACKSEDKSIEPQIKQNDGKLSFKNITPQEAKKRLDTDNKIVLLDVRTQQEYDEKHIPNSMLIPVDVLEEQANKNLPDKNADIFVYCRSGRRSVTASEILIRLGYKNVYNLGGINDWPYEILTGK